MRSPRILAVLSYRTSHPWSRKILEKITERLANADSPAHFELIELDAMRNRDEAIWRTKFEHFLPKLQAGKIDLIYAQDDDALGFLLRNAEIIPESVPILFSGCEAAGKHLKDQRKNLSGVIQPVDIASTFRTAHLLLPDADGATIIINKTPVGRQLRKKFEAEANDTVPGTLRVSWLEIDDDSPERFFHKLEQIPQNHLVILTPCHSFASTEYLSAMDFLKNLLRRCSAPVFGCTDMLLGHGLIGGHLVSAGDQGNAVAELMLDTLRLGSARTLPIRTDIALPVFDGRVLSWFQLPEQMLPMDAVLLNVPASSWERMHRPEYQLALVLLLLAILVAVLLLLLYCNHAKRHRHQLQEANRRAEIFASENALNMQKLREANSLWNSVINSVPLYFFAKDAENDFQFVLANRAFLDMLGCSGEEVAGKTDYDLFPVDAADAFRLADQEAFQSGHIAERNELIPGANGEIRHVWMIRKPFEGERKLLLTAGLDMTELNSFMETDRVLNSCLETLIDEENLATSIRHALGAIASHLHADRCFLVELNRQKKTMTVPHEYAAAGLSPVLSDHRQWSYSEQEQWYQKFAARNVVIQPELKSPLVRKTMGTWFTTFEENNFQSFCGCGIFSSGNDLEGMLCVIFDARSYKFTGLNLSFLRGAAHIFELVLARSRRRIELVKALREAQEANKAKSYFVASVSHEIRTPLNAVIALAELLRQENLDPATHNEYLESIEKSGNALLRLVNDVLDLSKLETARMNYRKERFSFSDLTTEVVELFRYRAGEKRIELICEDKILPEIEADQARLRQVLFNLIGNAVKFTEHGEVRIGMQFEPETPETGTLRFHVQDTGIGISQADCKSIFEPFVQSSHYRGTCAENQGTGLGLSISRRMMEQMGGQITVKSELGKGSRFEGCLTGIVYHPAKLAADKPAKKTSLAQKQQNLSDFAVMIVDDVPLNLKVLGALLQTLGVKAQSATSGADALKLLAQRPSWDLLITDLWMPEMNGAELVKAVRARPATESPVNRIVALTADVENAGEFDMKMFDAVMTKPVTRAKVLELLDAILAH
ncbi:MAG: ATP-binding protein [Victivallaceae bacterium]|nr:ATP-binding protein [Victivallaceae bacterium]